MARIAITCTSCQNPLTNGWDTFGDIYSPFCWNCYSALCGEGSPGSDYYGIAPHHHDLSVTGSIVGSTVLDPLPEPNQFGEYMIGDQVFIPTEPGMGIWSHRSLPGWR